MKSAPSLTCIRNEAHERGFQYRYYDFGEVRMAVLQHHRGSTSCLDVGRGIV